MEKTVLELIYDLNVKYTKAEGQEERKSILHAISVIKDQFEDNYDEWKALNDFGEVCELYSTFKQDFETTLKIYEQLKG